MPEFKSLKDASEAFDALVNRVSILEANDHSHTVHLTNVDDAVLELHEKLEKAPAAAIAAINAPVDEFSPTWVYNTGERSRIVKSKIEFDTAIDDGWVDSPAKLPAESKPAASAATQE